MCGIVGVVGQSQAAPLVLKALKKLEYRGYDSAGIATSVNSHLELRKGIGKLDEVEKNCRLSSLPGEAGIGHTRWATHGKVTAENAHPHYDCSHKIALVHNGIIENYQELRADLIKRHKFISDTDTEVIAHMIEDEMAGNKGMDLSDEEPGRAGSKPAPSNNSLESAVYRVIHRLKGSYALLVVSSHDPGKIVAARKESPLVIGIGQNRNFIASDVLCFLDQTNLAVYVEDGEMVVLTSDSIRILDRDFHPVLRTPTLLDIITDEVTKGGNDYFMMKEILEQPQSIRRALEQDSQTIMDMAIDMLRAKQVVLTGCGTSRHAALIGRYAFSKLAGLFSEVVMGSEFQYFSDSIDKNTVVIAVSQSGETADVIQGVKKAKENGAKVFSIVNTHRSTLSRLSDRTVNLKCGPEIAVAATKSFTSELTVFYLLAFAMQNRQAEGIKKLLPLADLIEENLKNNGKGIKELGEQLKNKRDFYFLGRGINYAIAGEGALKLKEIAYVHAEGMAAGELKHGTLALIEHGTPVVALCPNDYTHDETLSNIMETRARGAFVIGVSDQNNPAFDAWIHIPQVEEIFYPLVSIIPLQMLAYHSAIARGFDPDKPRNLAKSVTVK